MKNDREKLEDAARVLNEWGTKSEVRAAAAALGAAGCAVAVAW